MHGSFLVIPLCVGRQFESSVEMADPNTKMNENGFKERYLKCKYTELLLQKKCRP